MGSVLMDNRHGLIVATDVRAPSYDAEPEAAVERLTTLEPRAGRRTRGADKSYDRPAFVDGVRACHTTPHVAGTFGVRVRPTGASERPSRGRRSRRSLPDTRPTPIEIPIQDSAPMAHAVPLSVAGAE